MNDFTAVSQWQAFSSGLVQVRLAAGEACLVMHYDFGGAGGFVVARREWSLQLPERFRIHLRLRGEGLRNRLELKLVDPTGTNVWWYRKSVVEWRDDWELWQIESHDIEFAWGPAGGGRPTLIAAVEFAIVAEAGGAGSLQLADWQIEDLSAKETCVITASDTQPGFTTDLLQGAWRSATLPAWIQLDLQEIRSFAALHIVWDTDAIATAFRVALSNDAATWCTLLETQEAGGVCSDIYLGQQQARWIRVQVLRAAGALYVGIESLQVIPVERAGTPVDFLHDVAAREARGAFPRYWQREQSYWTVFGHPECPTQGLLNEDGVVEVHRAGFSLEPFIHCNGQWWSWDRAHHEARLADGCLPVPSVSSDYGAFRMQITATAVLLDNEWCAWLDYAIENSADTSLAMNLVVAVRPFQVVPPWQAYREFGGIHAIRQVEWQRHALLIDERCWVIPQAGARGRRRGWLQPRWFEESLDVVVDVVQPELKDGFGLAQGEMVWSLTLAAGETRRVVVAVPFREISGAGAERIARVMVELVTQQPLSLAAQVWRDVLNTPHVRLPAVLQDAVAVWRTSVAHILLNRDGAAIQPGPRRYARSWIRDGATMCAALLRTGNTRAVRDFLMWYAPFVQADGFVPCCVDREGVDLLVEHDSHGQWMHVVAEYFLFSGDHVTVDAVLPSVLRAGQYLMKLRASRCTAEYEGQTLRSCRGLIPESVSHEGYLAQPVHSYWDSFWAIRGLQDTAALCLARQQSRVLHNDEWDLAGWAERFAAEAQALRADVTASIARVIAERAIPHIPGSVEWADADPTASACAVGQLGEEGCFPADALRYTFDGFMQHWRTCMVDPSTRTKYSAYDIRVINALVKLGRREDAWEVARFFLQDRRPHAWNQWPEITWPDPRSPGHLGDLPHSWIGAEYVLAFRCLFVDEHHDRLLVGQGVLADWLQSPGVALDGWPTAWGGLGYEAVVMGDALTLNLSGDVVPPEGLDILLPFAGDIVSVVCDDPGNVQVQGVRHVQLRCSPARLVIQWKSGAG